jgi:hypothetical protein
MNLATGLIRIGLILDGFSQAVFLLNRVLAEHRYIGKNGRSGKEKK